jgi:MFS family permease
VPTTPLTAPPPPSVWQLRPFRRLWLAGLISQSGDRIHQVALLWWATEKTHSPAVAGTLLMVSTLPLVLLSPLAGWLADHWGRRPVMVIADVLRLLLTLVMTAALLTDRLTVNGAVVLSLLMAVGGALFNPASMAIIPDVVPDEALLPQANSWQELNAQVTGVLGPAAGGVLVAAIGVAASFALNAVSFVLSAILLLQMRLPTRSDAPAAEGGGLGETLAYLRAHAGVLWLLVSFAVLNFFSVPVLVYIPYFANDVFHVGATGYGLLEAAPALGMGAAVLWVTRKGEPGTIRQVYPIAVFGQALALAAMGLWPSMGCFLAALTVVGVSIGFINVIVISHFQRVVPAEQMGRFMGLLLTVSMAIVPVSFGLAGVLTHRLVPTLVLTGCGAVLVGLSLALRRMPGLAEIGSRATAAPSP